jgi:hypothetical protein
MIMITLAFNIRAITIRSDNGSYMLKAITIRSDNYFVQYM